MESVSVEKLQRLLRKAVERAERAKERMRRTTLTEYIVACHTLVFSRFDVETDRQLTSGGGITNPRNKLLPTKLEPWSGFLEQQRATLSTLYATFPGGSRVFENCIFLEGLGDRVARRKISNEKVVEYFQHNSVEDPIRVILDRLREVAEV